MLNKVIEMGRMVKEPELKTTTSGNSVLSFTIAVNRDYKDQEGNYPTDFLDCVAWRNTAEFISKYFSKGSLMAIEGSLQTRMWEDKNGNKRKAVEIIVSSVHFCEGKKNSQENGSYTSDYGQADPPDEFEELTDDDELPF